MARFPINESRTADLLKEAFALLEDLDGLTVSDCIDPVYVVGSSEDAPTAVEVARIDAAVDADRSGIIDLGPRRLAAIYMPPDWTAGTIGFEVARDPDGTFLPLFDDAGNAVALTVAADTVVGVDVAAGALAAVRYVKLTCSVSQTADRLLFLILKR